MTNRALLDFLATLPDGARTPRSPGARTSFTPGVSSRLSAAPVGNDAHFNAPFFQRFVSAPLSLELAPGVVKDYQFPTFYAHVTTGAALFLADHEASARLLPPGLQPLRVLPGKTLVAISSYHYGAARGLAPYNELAISVMLSPSRAYVVSMPVSSEENRIRGRALWGLPKEVRRIALRQVGTEWVATVQDAHGRVALQLRLPLEGRERRVPERIAVVSSKDGKVLESQSMSEGEGAVAWLAGRPWVSEESEEARLIRGLRLSPVALRTQVATGVRSTFSLPEPGALP